MYLFKDKCFQKKKFKTLPVIGFSFVNSSIHVPAASNSSSTLFETVLSLLTRLVVSLSINCSIHSPLVPFRFIAV